LIEVDNMIHAAFLGESFEKRVTHQCDVLQVPASAQGTSQSYITFAFVVFHGKSESQVGRDSSTAQFL